MPKMKNILPKKMQAAFIKPSSKKTVDTMINYVLVISLVLLLAYAFVYIVKISQVSSEAFDNDVGMSGMSGDTDEPLHVALDLDPLDIEAFDVSRRHGDGPPLVAPPMPGPGSSASSTSRVREAFDNKGVSVGRGGHRPGHGRVSAFEAFDNAQSSFKIMYIYSNSCGYCRAFHPTFEKFSAMIKQEYPDIQLVKKEISEIDSTEAAKLDISAFPTIVIFDRAHKEVTRIVGKRELVPLMREVKGSLMLGKATASGH